MLIDILQMVLVLLVMTVLVVPVGRYLANTFTGERHLLPERLTYRLLGVDPAEEMSWKRYALVMVLANLAMLLLGYLLLRLQSLLPLNPQGLPAQLPDQAFNTAVSFVTNTNWQSYAGEVSLSNFSQMAVIQFLMFVSAGTGLAAGAAFIRGLSRTGFGRIGNFWVDLTRVLYRVMLPLCLIIALVFVWQGMPQTLEPSAAAITVEGASQEIARGPVASLESIKHVGTNGGGFFNMNAAHPYENPTPLTNVLNILSMLLITSSLTYAFGTMLARRRQGWVFFATFAVMFVGFLAVAFSAEQYGNPLLTEAGADQALTSGQSGGNMEGKEVRFGIAQTSLFVTTTTAATTGTVNAMHDSLTPLGGFVPMSLMMLNTVFGGKGVGIINLIQYAIIAVFIVGLMVGRSPEFLGKKIEAKEVSLTVLALLAHPASILGFTGLAVLWPGALESLANPAAHGFSEIVYAYSSGTANNGSAFAGLSANTPFYNTTIGLAMLIGRYMTLLPMLAVVGSLAAKKSVPEGRGTFSTATPLFAGVLVATVLIIGGLTFFPTLALGPIVEHFQMLAGRTFT